MAYVVIPAKAHINDLRRPDFWKKRQQNYQFELKRFDEVKAVWKDFSRMVKGEILAADESSAVFYPTMNVELPQQKEKPKAPLTSEKRRDQTVVM